MDQITIRKLLLFILAPTLVLSLSYLILGHICSMPYILLFCLLGLSFLAAVQ